jgi:bacterioferritin
VQSLQEALKAELTAVHQYLLHSKLCQSWGYVRLAEQNRHEAIDELAHAEAMMERMQSLKATPNMTEMFALAQCSDVKEQLESSLTFEKEAIARLNQAMAVSVEAHDNVSRRLFSEILKDEDHHVDHLEGQLHAIEEIGLSSYLAQQIHK